MSAAGPPALNVYKKISVIRHADDHLTYEDATGNTKSVSVQELGDAIASATPLHTPRIKLDIPVPRINTVEDYEKDIPANYKLPNSYIRYHRLTPDDLENVLEYVADQEDELWLYQHPKFGATTTTVATNTVPSVGSAEVQTTSNGSSYCNAQGMNAHSRHQQLQLRMLEQMMDLLEKATAFEVIITMHQAEKLFQQKLPKLYQLFPQYKPRQGSSTHTTTTSKHVIQEVYNYWVQKRSKLKRPLLRRFWPVTSTEDTNPHLVFRPREKEKYKLRKKRQNDANAYRKLKQLREDFDNLRAVLDLVRNREHLYRTYLLLHIELFEQRLYDTIDTSGQSIRSEHAIISKDQAETTVLNLPNYFDTQIGGRRAKRTRKDLEQNTSASFLKKQQCSTSSSARLDLSTNRIMDGIPKDPRSGSMLATIASSTTANTPSNWNIAGRNHGEPAPHCLQPLATRETYAHSWDHAVPYIPTAPTPTMKDNPKKESIHRFRHRPRVGRGGRLCIDRIPMPFHDTEESSSYYTVYTAGRGMPRSLQPQQRLLDLLPTPLDYEAVSRNIEAKCVSAIKEDQEASRNGGHAILDSSGMATNNEDNDGEEIIIPVEDWLDTDEQLWGEERFAIGPF
jgi:enhancer of polycomb-like protein